ncbi:NAD-dependent epimerase/dehydratase family protein [Chitiniphilus purpureus]|uniref:NAD-dependent epimerase/dehydratase family protein n=1 Tax=Chitiniphilus purpureus TaxID=2981137 RepID=A0ABY6DMK5_9NEIS|nr:NAD-dependent epimerase/dehydratase family protein [Chitiniphilus sp. CD1]UXY15574.1 NAD-dependent epimerase/dehydratase family protein [Chitiniphilus sp. CD1]
MKILVTGAAGFIGMHLSERLLALGHQVHGIDSLNSYYDPALKQARLARLTPRPGFSFERLDVAEPRTVDLIRDGGYDTVVHLAAQAGVRYSIDAPLAYSAANLAGFTHVLEGCRHGGLAHLIFASSSSVYGGNRRLPFRESDSTEHPVSFYAATKKANEAMAHSYAHLYGLPVTGLRFFTVYGPWGRPDMAYYKFAQKIVAGEAIDVYNHGNMQRDFTYIDDIVAGIVGLLDKPAAADPAFDVMAPRNGTSWAPYRILNIGGSNPAPLSEFIALLEQQLGRVADKRYLPMQAGDVEATYADTSALEALIGPLPRVGLGEGLARFVAWFKDYHGG